MSDVHNMLYLPAPQLQFKKFLLDFVTNVYLSITYLKTRSSDNPFSDFIGIIKLLDPIIKPLDWDKVNYKGGIYGIGHKLVELVIMFS